MNTSAQVLITFAEFADAGHRSLTALDQAVGDGDFGDNLRDGTRRYLGPVRAAQDVGEAAAVQAAAAVFLDEIGGTSGPLLGLLLEAIGDAIAAADEDADPGWRSGLVSGTQAIQRVGEAEPGDRTLVDALAAANEALQRGDAFADALEVTITATAATARTAARRGRSSYLGERAVGTPDPGCVGIALLLGALASAFDPEAGAADATRIISRCWPAGESPSAA